MITRKIGGSNFDIYSKGSPEMITSLCKPETGMFCCVVLTNNPLYLGKPLNGYFAISEDPYEMQHQGLHCF